jgi:hypothetical protein
MFSASPICHFSISGSERLSSPSSANAAVVSMRVLWTVSEYKIGKGAVWGDEEAHSLLFKPLDIRDTSITFDGKTCSDIIFKKEVINTDEYLHNKYHTDRQSLGIVEDTVELIKTNCNLPGFAEYMRLQDRRLIIHINGVFFYLSPAVNY